MITIVDYGAGNLFSIANMLKKIGVETTIGRTVRELGKAEKLILPGVGAFDTCAGKLQASGLQEAVIKKVISEKTPVLGICVGMQLMTQGSEEGKLPGLGWFKGKTIKFNHALMPPGYKIPHMGWADVQLNRPSRLFAGMEETPRFYFVHSYYVAPEAESDVLARSAHGQPFTAALERDNILGVQFHPEKSHRYGMKLLENFATRF
jgi:glutamine amidotransferase